jgi:hypothetical protein
MDDGTFASAFTPIYSGNMVPSVTATGLTPGKEYHFKTTASNAIGESKPSSEVGRFAAELPSTPASLSRGAMSTRTQIELVWPIHPDNDIPISGYILEADINHNDVFEVIWNGQNRPELTNFVWTGVVTSQSYEFRYKVLN